MTRYAPGYRKIFLEHNGSGPWKCAYEPCSELVYVFGKRSREGAIHHKDEDKHNNDPENLEIMHFGCHRRHHMIARNVSTETRANMSRAQQGRNAPSGWHHSDETKQKISNKLRGRYQGRLIMQQCECSKITNSGTMVSHLKASGHKLVNEMVIVDD